MADRSIIEIMAVSAGGTEIYQTSVIPIGKGYVIKKLGASVPATNDGYSCSLLLKYGADPIRAISLNGNTIELSVMREIVGDGSKKLSVTIQNPSSTSKQVAFWIDAYERE